jgi:hypothetical protein
MKRFVVLAALLSLMGAGCAPVLQLSSTTTTSTASVSYPNTASILVSNEDSGAYCNGDAMDSTGYERTISHAKQVTLDHAPINQADYIKSILLAATSGMCQQVISQSDISIDSEGTLHIPPTDGWAGVSITMCSCVPQVRTNALHIAGVKKLEWGNIIQ